MPNYLKAKAKSHLGSARFRYFMNAGGDEAHGSITVVIQQSSDANSGLLFLVGGHLYNC